MSVTGMVLDLKELKEWANVTNYGGYRLLS